MQQFSLSFVWGLKPMRWLTVPFRRYADFKGRSGRKEFWTFFGLSVAALLLTVVAMGLLTDATSVPQPKAPRANASPAGAIGYMLWWLASIVPWLAVQVRRFHDQGRSGWLCLIGVGGYVAVGFGAMPLAGIMFLAAMAMMVLPGEETENRFGMPVEPKIEDELADEANQFSDSPESVFDDISDANSAQQNENGAIAGDDGRYYVRGQAFASLVEAERVARRFEIRHQSRHETSSSDSAGLDHDNSTELSLEFKTTVVEEGRGLFTCGGHIFSTRDEADWFDQRRALALASIANSPVASEPQPNSTTNAWNEIEAGINFGRDGCFYVQGKSYWTIEEARAAKSGALIEQQRPHDGIPQALEVPIGDVERGEAFGSVDSIPTYMPADVKSEGNGRFSCGGYTFNSLEQALSFARRRSDRSKKIERSVSPFSFTPIPKPPQPTPPKVERSGFFGFDSSAKKQAIAEHWVATPTNLSAGGVPFQGALIYFGTRPHNQRYEQHRSLINPNLEVSSNGRDWDGAAFSYWPNYSELTPEARRSYLKWISGSRSNPSTPIGYVFIYFYGLERRLVKDRSEADAPAIMGELRRLLAIYGDNHSFKNYCSALLDMGELLFGNVDETPTPTLDNRYSWELPIRLRVYLGKKVAAGQALDSNDALCWTLGHPLLYPRTPVTRCFSEFCKLWKVRFGEQFPNGLSFREPKARLNFQYRSASSEFSATATVDNLPDVGAISGPISKFELLLGSCSDELDPLSRFLGRNPAEKDSAIAGALLPKPLRDYAGQSNFGQFSQFLSNASQQTGFAEVGIPEIMAALGFRDAGKSDERRALHLKRLPELFDAAGFGFEPDKRFGPAPSLTEDMKLCVFPAERGGAVNANRPEYLAARTMAEIAALAARADDLVVDAEIASITADLVSLPEISDLDRSRLRAHAMALLANPSKLKAATKRLCELPENQREAALASAVRAVLADQLISPSEVRFLEGLYKALGLPQDEVYSRLHSGEASPKPAIKSALHSAPGLAREATGTEIDHEKLARLKEETSAVSSMLASIFKEDETLAQPVDGENVVETEIAGLDAAHSGLLVRLTEAPLDSDAFEAICRKHKLLPSGAIETINDWAFDALDDYAVEEGELICIQEHLIEPIKTMRKVI
jgi:uncharacterized membrane protein YhaH (DUF805 family)